MSTAVIDEAAYDPSLRFVLVAAVLFVLFTSLLFSELINDQGVSCRVSVSEVFVELELLIGRVTKTV